MTLHLMPRAALGVVLVLGFLLGISPACTRQTDTEVPAPDERRFPLTGLVLAVDATRKQLRVQHEEIPDFMPAMTMDFVVSDGDLAVAREGHRIRATLVQRGGDFLLEQVWPDDAATNRAIGAGAAALKQDTVIRGAKAYREVGETVPDFTLLDQSGSVVQINRFRGKQVVLNFIYSRCPIPTMCPAATARMVALQRAARAAGITDLELVSVTLDPAYDTPGVLRDYAAAQGIELTNFSLLTGPEPAIRDLLAQMGVIAQFDGALIKHSLTTVLINADGKIVWREDGSAWAPDVFIGRMRKG